jgi:hypothetical protein
MDIEETDYGGCELDWIISEIFSEDLNFQDRKTVKECLLER